MTTLFCELPIGARFEFRGRRYEKLALSLARDEERFGNVFQDATEVFYEPLPPASPKLARRPAGPHWTTYLSRAPGQA